MGMSFLKDEKFSFVDWPLAILRFHDWTYKRGLFLRRVRGWLMCSVLPPKTRLLDPLLSALLWKAATCYTIVGGRAYILTLLALFFSALYLFVVGHLCTVLIYLGVPVMFFFPLAVFFFLFFSALSEIQSGDQAALMMMLVSWLVGWLVDLQS